MSEPNLHRSDPTLRRMAVWGISAACGAGLGALWGLNSWLDAQGRSASNLDTLILIFVGLAVLTSAGMLLLAGSLWREARLVSTELRYPPSNMRTLRDVPIKRGDQARSMARALHLAGVVFAIGAAALLWQFWATLQAIR